MNVRSFTMRFVISPESLVNVPIGVNESAPSTLCPILEVPFVDRAVLEIQLSATVHHILTPLARVLVALIFVDL